MTDSTFLPWHVTRARTWLSERDRFAHAWLIHGLAGIGKVSFARASAAALLCEMPVAGLACGQCPACQWVRSGNHPDLRLLRPEAVAVAEGEDEPVPAAAEGAAAKRAPSKEIRIDQIRQLSSWFNTATHRQGWRVAVIYPAQALNVMAANALLKVLEEPPPSTVFLLVAEAPDQLLPTLVSRCRRLPLPAPEASVALEWLQDQDVPDAADWLAAAGGAPLAAQRLAAEQSQPCPDWLAQMIDTLSRGAQVDAGALADGLDRRPAAEWIDALQRLHVDLSLCAAGQQARYYPALARATNEIARKADSAKLAEAARWVTQQRGLASHPLNAKLFAHACVIRTIAACQRT